MRGYLFAAAILAVVSAGSVGVSAQAPAFVFTAVVDPAAFGQREGFGRVAVYLQQKLGVDVEYLPVGTHAAAVAAMESNQAQLAWLDGLSGVRARSLVPGSEAIAQGREDVATVTYLIANVATGLRPSQDFPMGIEGRTFAFGPEGSTAGRLMPEFHIRDNLHKLSGEAFPRIGFGDDAAKTIALVESGIYEVGAVPAAAWNAAVAEGEAENGTVYVLWATPPYADFHWTIRGDVDRYFGDGFEMQVSEALLSMEDPALLAPFGRVGFIPARNEDYEPVRKTATALGLIE